MIAKYRIACSHVCGGVFARNGFWGTVGKRVAGNPSVDFFQKILVEWMLRVCIMYSKASKWSSISKASKRVFPAGIIPNPFSFSSRVSSTENELPSMAHEK